MPPPSKTTANFILLLSPPPLTSNYALTSYLNDYLLVYIYFLKTLVSLRQGLDREILNNVMSGYKIPLMAQLYISVLKCVLVTVLYNLE